MQIFVIGNDVTSWQICILPLWIFFILLFQIIPFRFPQKEGLTWRQTCLLAFFISTRIIWRGVRSATCRHCWERGRSEYFDAKYVELRPLDFRSLGDWRSLCKDAGCLLATHPCWTIYGHLRMCQIKIRFDLSGKILIKVISLGASCQQVAMKNSWKPWICTGRQGQ